MDFNRSSEIPSNPNDPNSQFYNPQQHQSCYYAQFPYYAAHHPSQNPNPNTTVPTITYDTSSYAAASCSSVQSAYGGGDPYGVISSYSNAHVVGGGYEAQVPMASSYTHQQQTTNQVEVLTGGVQQFYYQDPGIAQYGAVHPGYAVVGALLRAPSSSVGQMIPSNPHPAFPTTTAALRPMKRSMKKGPKKTKIVQSAWCDICSTDCTTKEVLDKHRSGKKHQKNLKKKLEESIKKPTTIAGTSSAALVIGPKENPSKDLQMMKKPSSVPDEDVETKRKKLMEGGAAANSVRVCTICNIVVNSQTVFAYHLAGQKHAAMVKKQASGTAVVPHGVVTAA